MIFQYNRIKIKNRTLLLEGKIEISDVGVCQIKGKNGSGKTLLLNHLFLKYRGIYNICFINQSNYAILRNRSVAENIAMSTEKDRLKIVEKIVSELELSYLLNLDTRTLSGGEKRIISVLRAIVSECNVIFMDEPTNDLDYRIVEKIINLIKRYRNEKLFVLVSHDDWIDDISDEIYILEEKMLRRIKSPIKIEAKKNDRKNFKKNLSFEQKHLERIMQIILS